MTEQASGDVLLPEGARAAWTSLPGNPLVGQIWRARWEDTALLVLLTEVTRTWVRAAPITAETDLATTAAVVLPPEATTLATPLAVWDQLITQLPVAVLDRRLGKLSAGWSRQPGAEALIGLEGNRGRMPRGRADRRVEEQARLEDGLDLLARATWAPQGTGTLAQLFGDLGVTSDELRSLPGVKSAEVLALRRGTRPVMGPQVDALVELTKTPAEVWWAANPSLPAELVEVLDQPGARAEVAKLAVEDGRVEVDERRAIAYAVYALAARQTGEREGEDWAGRLAQYLIGRTGGRQPW